MKHLSAERRPRATITTISVFGAGLALAACVSFTRDGQPISSWGDKASSGGGDDRGRPFGKLWITYYWLVEQRD
jgi:hypothetical protein